MRQPIVILGAGLAGLSCAYHAQHSAVVFEREDTVGGTARTIRRGDFYFDCTGHWLHLRDTAIRELVEAILPSELVSIQRRAAVYSHGTLTPYPYQANTYGLPPKVVAECVLGFFRAREAAARGAQAPPRSFEDYIRQCLGDGIAEHFMIPYNTKLWTVPPSAMSHTWCGRFVPIPTPEEVVFGALTPGGAGHALGYNASFLYPRRGGIGRLPQALANRLRGPVQVGCASQRINTSERWVELSNGTRASYDVLVSTLPLPHLVAQLDAVPEMVRDAVRRLRATSVTYWDIGLRRPTAPSDPHWIYYPEPDIPFYRMGSASAVLADMAPPGHTSLYVETAHTWGSQSHTSDEAVLAALRRVGIVGAREEPVLWVKSTIEFAYAIMDHAYGAARETILEWLLSQRIVSVGRYGAWVYDSMEGAIIAGRDAARQAEALL